MQQKLFPVWGSTGEYADYHQWVVGLFPYEQSAKAVAKALNKVAKEQGVDRNPSHAQREYGAVAMDALHKAGDPVALIDYTGIKYTVGNPLRQFVDAADFKMTAHRR